MKFVTASFFDKKNHKGPCFSIAMSQPRRFNLRVLNSLRPSWKLVSSYRSGKITEKEYSESYRKQVLQQLSATEFIEIISILIRKFSYQKEVTLLCWEPEGKFCHRQLVADWLMKHGYEIETH